MPNARLKIRVYGRLYNSIQGERIRYVDADQVCSADKWNISKNEGKLFNESELIWKTPSRLLQKKFWTQIRERCDDLQNAMKMLHDLKEDSYV